MEWGSWRGAGGACDGIRPPLRPKDQTAQSGLYGVSFNLPSMERGELHNRCVCLLLADYIQDIGAAKPNAKSRVHKHDT